MGYGGTGYATVNVDIAQADVQAIVDGITGVSARTLSDIENDLLAFLYNGTGAINYLEWIQLSASSLESYLNGNYSGVLNNGTFAVDFLNYIYDSVSSIQSALLGWTYGVLYNGTSVADYLESISNYTSSTQDYLYDLNSNQSAASLLADIRDLLQQFTFDADGRLRVTTTG